MPFLNDTFTGTNGTNLTAHTPETGGAWSLMPGSSGTVLIDGNHAYPSVAAPVPINAATPPSADYDVIGQMIVQSAIHNTSWGVVGRASNSAYTCYVAFIYAFSGNFTFLLSLYNASAYSNFTSVSLPSQPTAGSTHEIKLRMVGNQISAFYDGLPLIAPVTDATIAGPGFAGLFLVPAATTTTGVHVDSVTAAAVGPSRNTNINQSVQASLR